MQTSLFHSLIGILRICMIIKELKMYEPVAKPIPTFGHANANFSVFMDRIEYQFLK